MLRRSLKITYDPVPTPAPGTTSATTAEAKLRQKVVNTARSYIGLDDRDGSHKPIIDLYNSRKPLARDYEMTLDDPWCDAFVSAMFIQTGLTDAFPIEISCTKHIELIQNSKWCTWQENGNYVPKPGDIIFYAYGVSKQPNDADPEHVGIVQYVVGNTIVTIEGNNEDCVKEFAVKVGDPSIRDYGLPNYAAMAAGTAKYKAIGTAKTTAAVNLRAGPSTSNSLVTVVPQNTTIQILEKTNRSWYRVKYEGYIGFISTSYLK